MSDVRVGTCQRSLMWPGECCMADCDDKATIAVLVASDSHTDGAIECARCAQHVTGGGTVLASKPLILRPEWTG